MLTHFRLAHYRFTLAAGVNGLILPRYKGSALRGSFGHAFRRVCCSQHTSECASCMLCDQCPYAYVFETSPNLEGHFSNLRDVPRPFVFEPSLDNRTVYRPGEAISFGVTLIGRAIDYLPYFIIAFQEVGRMGLGQGRQPCTLDQVDAVNPWTGVEQILFRQGGRVQAAPHLIITEQQIAARALVIPECHVALRFVTMTRIKYKEQLQVKTLPFHVLLRAVLRRVSSLSAFHHQVPLAADFINMHSLSEAVEVEQARLSWVDWERYSYRQGEKMNLGGLVGEVSYKGDLRPFRELLALGELVHVGKNAVFGLGKYQVIGDDKS